MATAFIEEANDPCHAELLVGKAHYHDSKNIIADNLKLVGKAIGIMGHTQYLPKVQSNNEGPLRKLGGLSQ